MTTAHRKGAYAPGERYKKVRPAESHAHFPNPHKGMVTFQHFQGDPPTPPPWSEQGPTDFGEADLVPKEAYPGCLPSTVAYCRWFWDSFEPEEGRFCWDMVEGALRKARARGQTLHVRLQPFGSARQPQLPGWFQARAPTQRNPRGYIDPVYDSQPYLECWQRVLESFAERFDGRPGLDVLDIAFVGPWGEGAGQLEGLISLRRVEAFIDAYVGLFRHIHLVVNAGPQFDAGTRRGTGWRVDSFGDVACDGRGVVPDGAGWNHMYDSYPRLVRSTWGRAAWEHAPVSFEWGQSLEYFIRKNHPVDFIVQQGLKYHGSFLMPRNLHAPEELRSPLLEFAKRMGYRLVLRQFQCDRHARPDDRFGYSLWIENVGVAPLYHHYPLAFRFTQGGRSVVALTPHDPRTWLPGDTWIDDQAHLPAGFTAGEVMIHVALVDAAAKTPRVRFAVEGAEDDGWLPMDTIEVNG
jgi:hypothetical protein